MKHMDVSSKPGRDMTGKKESGVEPTHLVLSLHKMRTSYWPTSKGLFGPPYVQQKSVFAHLAHIVT